MKASVIAILAVVAGAVHATACSCLVETLCERLAETPVVFVGEVIDGGVPDDEDRWKSWAASARVRVIEAFRGVKPGVEIDVDLKFTPGMCAASPYVRGKQVLVYSGFDRKTHRLEDGPCTASLSAEWMAREIDTVRRYFRGEMKGVLYGRVAPDTPVSAVDYVLSEKHKPPLAGATVIVVGQGKRYESVTDAEGRFSIAGLTNGEYEVHAEKAGYRNREGEIGVEIKRRGCAVQDLSLWTEGTH